MQNLDYVFTGDFLGKTSDIGDGSLRGWEFRKFDHLVGDYFVAPAFIEAVTVDRAAVPCAFCASLHVSMHLILQHTAICSMEFKGFHHAPRITCRWYGSLA